MKLQEIELRALLTPAQKNKLQKMLAGEEYVFVKEVKVLDAYFCPHSVKQFSEIEMDSVGSFSLRLRQSIQGSEKKNELNIKVITKFGDHQAWDEHEVRVDDYKQMAMILKAIGFKVFFEFTKVRRVFRRERCTIFLEDIKKFGSCVEIEIMAPANKAESAKSEIKDLLRQLGVADNQIVKKSVTNLLMRKWSKF